MSNSESLQQRLQDSLKKKGKDYQPRTRHLHPDGTPIYTNRLIMEDSPYLLQHAHNPVNWYPWSKEAFSAAQELDKPIFLSIGYATCHWCHVMEEQSFESTTVAKVLNEHFISIKVDREQHPDIDATYMTAVTLLSGHGGWPMSSFLCPDGKPFYGGTYFPQASFLELLTQINHAWLTQRDTVLNQAEQLADAVDKATASQTQTAEIEHDLIPNVLDTALSNYDARYGGFSSAPKFPHEPLLLLLSRVLQINPKSPVASPFEQTLKAMAQGGIYDQVGGGFHRYAVDQYWLVPHFEKMLYNQAYLSRVYLQAFRLTGNPLHKRVVRQTLDYVLREMTDERGLFYSATDADSEGHEGTYFVWSVDEIHELLGKEDARFIIDIFNLTEEGNFEGKNILYLPRSLSTISQEQGQTLEQVCKRLDPLLETLRTYRQQRIPPLTDKKILVAWNGMMICALAEAGYCLKLPEYVEAAENAATAIWRAQREEKQLWRVNLQGKASVPARQEDYAHLAEALLTLYDVTDNSEYLGWARELTDEMLARFLDRSNGALFMGNESLLFTQPKDSYDGALPSGNAVGARVLSRLSRRSGVRSYMEQARNIVEAHASQISRQPVAYAYMLAQLEEMNQGEIADYQYIADGSIKIFGQLQAQSRAGNQYPVLIKFNVNDSEWHFDSFPRFTVINDQYWNIREVGSLKQNEKNFSIVLSVSVNDKSATHYPLTLRVSVQACDRDRCLPPEEVLLQLALVSEQHGTECRDERDPGSTR